MRSQIQRHAIILAALLQVLPIVRSFFANPAAASSFAFILRLGLGAGAVTGAYDSISRASAPVVFTSPTNFTGSISFSFTNNITLTNNKKDPGAFFVLTNKLGIVSAAISNGITTTNCLPTGLTFRCYDLNDGAAPPKAIYGSITGTPTVAVTNFFIHILAGYAGAPPVETNIFITIFPTAASPPSITNQPIASATNLIGTTNTSFSVTAGGTAPLSYQWFFNTNSAVTGATNPLLTLNNVQFTNAGYYRCTITNSAGATNSANALLTVWQKPNITNQPAGVTNVAGSSASFSVTAGGVPALSYQWKFNASNTVGANSSTLNFANLRASQAGNYSVVITNAAGSVTSSPALLGVTNPLPAVAVSPALVGANFQFTFNGIPGLTNTVQTNGNLAGNNWGVFTNLPPSANNNPITISNATTLPYLFYRVVVQP